MGGVRIRAGFRQRHMPHYRQPDGFLHDEQRRGDKRHRSGGRDIADRPGHHHHTAGALRVISDEIRHHHPLAYHRGLRRACALFRLPTLHGLMDNRGLLPAGTLHMASRRTVRYAPCA